MRLEAERIHLTKLMKMLGADLEKYNVLWGEARNLSYAGSTFPYPEAWVVGTYQIILTLYMRIFELEEKLEEKQDSTTSELSL